MKTINNYIDTINQYLNEHLKEGVNWASAVKNLSTYLNAHNFVQHEGIAINDNTIDDFITRIISENKTDDLNFLPNNKLVMSKKPNVIRDETLDQYRTKYFQGLQLNRFPTRNLAKDRETINSYTQFFKERGSPFPKKEKKQKIGNLGMKELTDIVLTMNQDIKQIKDAQSLEGARAWVEKHGSDLYHVEDADINGDNIPDIIIKNKDGQNVIVNGYTTDQSTYPYRYSYYTQYPTAEARKHARDEGITFREYIKGMYNPQYDEYGMKIQRDQSGNPLFANQDGVKFENAIRNSGYNKIMRPKDKTPYQAFVSRIVKPIYNAVKIINQMTGTQTKSQLLTQVAAIMWNQTILIPAMTYVYGGDVTAVDDNEWKKLRNKPEVKNAVVEYVKHCLRNVNNLFEYVPLFVTVCNESQINIIPNEAAQWIIPFIKANLIGAKFPQLNDEQGWARINAQFEERFRKVD